MGSTTDIVRIRYHRPPDRDDVFVQRLLLRTPDCHVTLMPATPLREPLMINGHRALENGAPAIWFTFPGLWHDIGRFHLRDGTWTGTYANVITPVEFVDGRTWSTTDLFLDMWLDLDGRLHVLDEDEFDTATSAGWIDAMTAQRARDEVERIVADAAASDWPPHIVSDWTIEQVRKRGLWPERGTWPPAAV